MRMHRRKEGFEKRIVEVIRSEATKLLSLIRQAIEEYHMLEDGEQSCCGSLRRKGFSDITLCDEAVAEILSEKL